MSRMGPVGGLALLVMLLLAACNAQFASPLLTPAQLRQLHELFRQEQADRRAAWSSGWRLEGVLDLDTPLQERRNRVQVMGEGTGRARMVIHGPFSQIAGELRMDGAVIRMVDPGQRRVYEVSASAAGMARLTGLALEPHRLLMVLLGWTGEPLGPPKPRSGGFWMRCSDGEWIEVDPGTGLLLERRGETPEGVPYGVQYHWAAAAEGLFMPQKVDIRLGEETRVQVIAKSWSRTGDASALSRQLGAPPGFEIFRPEPGSGPLAE